MSEKQGNFPARLEGFLSWLLLPVYVWQGLKIRRKSIRLTPPEGSPVVALEGKGKPLAILVLGDSSAAGVGVEVFEESVAGRLPHLLSKLTKRPIYCRTAGKNSATAGQIRDFVVPNLSRENYDYIILNIGVNDAKNFHTGRRFCSEFGTLIYALRARFPEAGIIWSGILDLSKIPLLPFPLNKILGMRANIIRRNGLTLCRERGAMAPKSRWEPQPEFFSHDGFHASSEGYRAWAEELAEYIADLESGIRAG